MTGDRSALLARIAGETDPLPLRDIPVPAEVTRVEGCDCGGLEWHDVRCSLWSLPYDAQLAAVDAARGRLAAHTSALNGRLRVALASLEGGLQP